MFWLVSKYWLTDSRVGCPVARQDQYLDTGFLLIATIIRQIKETLWCFFYVKHYYSSCFWQSLVGLSKFYVPQIHPTLHQVRVLFKQKMTQTQV